MFYPIGTDYFLSEATYRMGFHHICSGPWCAERIIRQFGGSAVFFEFPINRAIYNTEYVREKKNLNLLFFARPEMERRCFGLGVEALRHFHRLCPEVEIILYGSRRISLPGRYFPHTNMGLIPDLSDLAVLYANADLGLVFSPTNPSLVPYEMMSCGCPVADLRLEDAALKYGGKTMYFYWIPFRRGWRSSLLQFSLIMR